MKAKILNTTLLISIATALVSGCSMRDPRFRLLAQSQTGLISSNANNKVDILWVIDNSGTMGPKQDNLATSINSFMSQFKNKGLDYKIGVVTTDIRPVDPLHPTDPNFSGQDGCIVNATGHPKVILPSNSNAATDLASNAQVGFYGDSNAQSLNVVEKALSSPNHSTGGCNEGFLRSNAFLAVVFFSDADDNSTGTVNGLVSFLDGIKPPTTLDNGLKVRSYFTSGMIVDDLAKPECVALGPFSEVGYKFLDIANATKGITSSICDADFSDGLLALSTKILESTTAVHLSREPDESTIVVYADLKMVPKDNSDGWSFDSQTNSIVFHGSYIPTSSSVELIINYTPKDIVR